MSVILEQKKRKIKKKEVKEKKVFANHVVPTPHFFNLCISTVSKVLTI